MTKLIHDEAMEQAREWVRTDPQAVREDVRRLGLDGAVAHNMNLIAEALGRDDGRWSEITAPAMRKVLSEA